MTTHPEGPITDPTESPDSGPDIEPPEEEGPSTAYNPFAPDEGFTAGDNPRYDPQSQPNL